MVNSTGSDAKAQVLAAVNVVELIGQTVKLKRRGKDYVGLCPFHQEKTPSFHVKPDKQYFICYGCKAAGNAIDFVIKRDRVEFVEALKALARHAGIELPRFGQTRQNTNERQAMLEAHSAAAALFEKLLSDPKSGQAPRAYLKQRGFAEDSLRNFAIGFVPDFWDTLLKSDISKKFPVGLLQQAGLIKPREAGGFYDTFRNRIMFPIRDESGRIIAFGGRVMPGSEDPAKYLNSPETPLFSKGRSIFGIDRARQRIVETRTVAVVEGYTDVVMAHQFGATNVVSILGTAMTEQHVATLRRYADRIVLLFDADTAGDTAVNRAVELFLTQPVEIAIASMPHGLDPDEFLLKAGLSGFEELLATAQDALAYKWKQLERAMAATDDLTGHQQAIQRYLEVLASARGSGPVDPIRWGATLTRVSRLTQIPVEELHRRFRSDRRPSRLQPVAKPVESRAVPDTADDRAEKWLLGVLLDQPHRWHHVQQHVQPEDFRDENRRELAGACWAHHRDEGEPTFAEFLAVLKNPQLVELAAAMVDLVQDLDADQAVRDALDHLAQARERTAQSKLLAELRRTTSEQTSAADEVELLKRMQEQARRPDLRRVTS